MGERLQKSIKRVSIILIVGAIYLIWVLATDIRVPCPIFSLTGYLCPACGVTRMIRSIFMLRFESAFYYNKFLFITLPFFAIYLIINEVRYVKTGEGIKGKLTIILWAYIAALVIFGIVRNIK